MTRRSLIFFAVVALGAGLLYARIEPLSRSMAKASRTRVLTLSEDQRAVVDRLNESFQRNWSEKNIIPAPQAEELTLARRLSLALVGTIPSLEEIRAIESRPVGERVEWHLARLLEDRRHHEYFAERFARAYVGVKDGPFIIYRRRRFVTWLADKFAANRPYDAIARDLVADTGLYNDQPATNFITATIELDEGTEADENELAGRVARVMTATRIDCAECHDHPFAEWRQEDFKSLAAFFANTRQTFGGVRDVGSSIEVLDRQSGETVDASPSVPFAKNLLPADGPPRKRLAAWVTHPRNRAFSRALVNRVWAMLFGRALVEPLDDIPHDDGVPAALDILADDFSQHGHDLRRLLTIIVSSQVFALDSRLDDAEQAMTPAHEETWAVFPLSRLRPEQMAAAIEQATSLETIDAETHLLLRLGFFDQRNEFVRRHGDAGEEELLPQGGTIPQRLLMMNGKLVRERVHGDLPLHAAAQLAALAPRDSTAIEIAYLTTLSRRPAAAELEHFAERLSAGGANMRRERTEDLYWALLNSTEFSWNH